MTKQSSQNSGRLCVRFSLLGFVAYSLSLIVLTGFSAFTLKQSFHLPDKPVQQGGRSSSSTIQSSPAPEKPMAEIPPWGELITQDVQIFIPDEFFLTDETESKIKPWVFEGMNLDQVRTLITACGMSSPQIERALSSQLVQATATNVIIQPDEHMIFSLTTDARTKLYDELAKSPANQAMRSPVCFTNSVEEFVGNASLDKATIANIKLLLYQRDGVTCFSDFEALMCRMSPEQRRRLIRARYYDQPGVLARLRIRPTTDVDRLLEYWCYNKSNCLPGLRPLLESLKRSPEGGAVSLLYFLPPFARERLYTYPLPTQTSQHPMDCHWSTMNFVNDDVDDLSVDGRYIGHLVETNYYPIPAPTRYGDLIFLMDSKNKPIHSAVYIADDIVFTKDGADFRQPWTLKRMKDLTSRYSWMGAINITSWRKKTPD